MAQELTAQQHIASIARWILASSHIVVFTGAGISTESGIPDFRGPDGVWTRRDAGLPPPQWRVQPDQIAPNPSHMAIASLQQLGKLQYLITQNTDNLHRRSGIRRDLLSELHGNGYVMRCSNCDREYTREELGWNTRQFGPGYRTQNPVGGQPACAVCGGRLISSVVNFGDPLPRKEFTLADQHARQCDLMFVLGSSLTVEPAASLVGRAIGTGARVVLVNQGATPYDAAVTLRLWTSIGAVIPPAVDLVVSELGELPAKL